tara:strand:+ start:1579 stop:2127 length:549 start_codon:yes stop_codon:yes gene_type:complete
MEIVKNIVEVQNIKRIIFVFAGTAILAISAKIQTPLAPVPATMQTFAVLFLGILLGPKLAFLTVLVYLIEGLIGLPVFAKGGGYIYFTGPTSGYLFGFLVGAYLSGKVVRGDDPLLTFFYLVFSVSSIYLLGLIWLWFFKGLNTSFYDIYLIGMKPFILVEFYKLLILAVVSKKVLILRKFI